MGSTAPYLVWIIFIQVWSESGGPRWTLRIRLGVPTDIAGSWFPVEVYQLRVRTGVYICGYERIPLF